MGGSSSQPRTDPTLSPINVIPVEELYMPEFSNSLQDNTGYWQAPNPHEYPVEQVATSPTKKKKATRNRQKRTIESDDASWKIPWTTKEEIALAKGWLAISENSKNGNTRRQASFWCEALQYIKSKTQQYDRRTKFDDQKTGTKRKLWRKNKGSKSAGSSNVNEDALARLMVTEMTAHEKEERLAFLDIKRREVECREREIEQQDMRFYLQPYDHLTGDQRKAMDEIRAKIKAKYNLQY
ncbi:hypothetical protein Tco_0064377 [Tanacetum coccineum]